MRNRSACSQLADCNFASREAGWNRKGQLAAGEGVSSALISKLTLSPLTEETLTVTPSVLPSLAVSVQRPVLPTFPTRSSGQVTSGFGWPVVAASFSATVSANLLLDTFGSDLPTLTDPEQPTSSAPAATADRAHIAAERRDLITGRSVRQMETQVAESRKGQTRLLRRAQHMAHRKHPPWATSSQSRQIGMLHGIFAPLATYLHSRNLRPRSRGQPRFTGAHGADDNLESWNSWLKSL